MRTHSAAYLEQMKELLGPLANDNTIQQSAEYAETTEEVVIETLVIFMQTNE